MQARRLWNGYPVYVWPLAVLLLLQVAYLIAEIAFNASLLNVASGAAGNPDSIDSLEVFGRVISGIGLGLLIFSSVFSRHSWSRKKVGWIIFVMVAYGSVIFPVSIYTMWHLQAYLVDDVVLGEATDEERYAATYIQYVSPSIRQGVLNIDELPLSRESLDRPETKTLLTLLMPVLMQNDELVSSLKNTAPDMIKFLSHRKVVEELDSSFEAYQQAVRGLEEMFDLYQAMAEKAEETVVKELETAKRGYDYRQLVAGMTKYYDAYKQQERKSWEELGNYVRRAMNTVYNNCRNARDPIIGGLFRMAKTCHLDGDRTPPLLELFEAKIGFEPTFDDYCPGGFSQKTCIPKENVLKAAKKTFQMMPAGKQREFMEASSRHRYIQDLDGIPIGLSVSEFFAHPKVAQRLSMTRVPGLEDSDYGVKRRADGSYSVNPKGYIRKRVYYTAARELASRYQAEIAKRNPKVSFDQIDDMLPINGISGRVSVTRDEFYELAFIGRVVNADGEKSWEVSRLKTALGKEDFFEDFMLKDALARVSEILSTLPQSVSDIQGSPESANDALRAVYVPAIALGFSLFFSLTNMVSVISRLIGIGFVVIPSISDRWVTLISKGVQFGGLAFVIGLPLLVTPNSMTQTRAMEVAADGADMPWAKYTLQWVMAVQPLIYPLGNVALGVSEDLHWYQYHDDRSESVSTEAAAEVSDVDLQTPFSVEALQSILQKEGHYRGTVDGIIGPMTTRAIKRFQKAEGLLVTGFQDRATILALLQKNY